VSSYRTRLAPSPTGSLHLGNAFSFVLNWTLAKQRGWDVILRIEDIDGPRKKTDSITETIHILQWLGLDWTGDALIQTEHLEASSAMLEKLVDLQLAYHCTLSRQEIHAALSAPHQESPLAEPSYRPKSIQSHNQDTPKESTNWRFVTTHQPVSFHDEIYGNQQFTSSQDFVVWTKSNAPSYQLAVVADDHRDKITHVVRGSDLLESTAWQQQLYSSMGWQQPSWMHHPLILGQDGKRLAKRHGDSRISTYRNHGIASDRIIGLIATWTNVQSARAPMSLYEFKQSFDINLVKPTNITFTKEDELWLFGSSQ